MKKIFFLSLIFSLSSIAPLMAENKLSDSSTQIIESNQRKFSKTDLVLKEGIFYPIKFGKQFQNLAAFVITKYQKI